jgi:DNA-binding NarL/FixJ family response regulator
MTEIVTKSPIRVLLVDDHPVVRAGLNSMLRKQTGLKIIGSLHGGREALEFLANEPADVMLLDLRMPNTARFAQAVVTAEGGDSVQLRT